MGTIVSNSHTLNRVGLFSDFIFVNVNDMNIYFFRIYIFKNIRMYLTYTVYKIFYVPFRS